MDYRDRRDPGLGPVGPSVADQRAEAWAVEQAAQEERDTARVAARDRYAALLIEVGRQRIAAAAAAAGAPYEIGAALRHLGLVGQGGAAALRVGPGLDYSREERAVRVLLDAPVLEQPQTAPQAAPQAPKVDPDPVWGYRGGRGQAAWGGHWMWETTATPGLYLLTPAQPPRAGDPERIALRIDGSRILALLDPLGEDDLPWRPESGEEPWGEGGWEPAVPYPAPGGRSPAPA